MDCRLIVDGPGDGPWNMARDEALSCCAAREKLVALRFYQWSRPTVSLGYFQRAADRESHVPSRMLELVRRATGGGAIVHDRELTYSLALPDPTARQWSLDFGAERPSVGLVALMHRVIQAALHSWSLSEKGSDPLEATHMFGNTQAAEEGLTPFRTGSSWPIDISMSVYTATERAHEFLCFQRISAGDLLIGDHKIGGSAQRRQRGGWLQHGSILLERSPHAPELTGIAEASGVTVPIADLRERIVGQLERAIRTDFTTWCGCDELDCETRRIAEQRFRQATWTGRR